MPTYRIQYRCPEKGIDWREFSSWRKAWLNSITGSYSMAYGAMVDEAAQFPEFEYRLQRFASTTNNVWFTVDSIGPSVHKEETEKLFRVMYDTQKLGQQWAVANAGEAVFATLAEAESYIDRAQRRPRATCNDTYKIQKRQPRDVCWFDISMPTTKSATTKMKVGDIQKRVQTVTAQLQKDLSKLTDFNRSSILRAVIIEANELLKLDKALSTEIEV